MSDATAGDPLSGLLWTHKSLRKIQHALRTRGYRLSQTTISRLLRERHYSMRVNCKRLAGKQSPGRDEQFKYIAQSRRAFLRRKSPVISVDTKKKELVGNFKQAGRQWRQSPHAVNIYDFPSQAEGKAIPYGIYDVGGNQGYVSVGVSHDTAEFAVASIRAWWTQLGRHVYVGCAELLIEADCGGSNGNRCQKWKACLQKFANEFRIRITVTHYPTGASKWNPVEHRMFNLISSNWAGQPLESYETILKHLRTTRSTAGFRCKARLDKRSYATGLKVSEEEASQMRVRLHKVFPHWNYTIYPHAQKHNA